MLDLATDEEDPSSPSTWASFIAEPSHYEVSLKCNAEDDELSEAEIALLTEIFSLHGGKSRWELVDFTHALPEWKAPSVGAFPITYGDILKAGGRSELEIAAVEDELAELAQTDLLLPNRQAA